MPDPNLQSYLAAHYLSGPKADAILARDADGVKVKRKKKKAKLEDTGASSGLVFKDDSDSWKAAAAEDDEDDVGFTPQIVGERDGGVSSKAFRKVGSASKRPVDENAVAESSTAASTAEGPSEFKAGLRTKEEMKAARLAREERKKQQEASAQRASEASASAPVNDGDDDDDEEARLAQQTVYRDSSGRVIDVAAHQAEQQRLERQRLAKDAERSTWSHGLVQKQQRQQAAAQLAAVQQQGIARRATDSEYNRHFRDLQRADDPALAFLTTKRTPGPVKPKYKGPWPPNRFNIAPGYRWDGVDRGNGYEKAFFERKAQLETRDQQARAWGQADM